MRNKILDLLKHQQGEYVSGESISDTLNITRAAVWKQIQGLKEAGYDIEGQTRRGYRLLKTPSALDEWALQQDLRTEALGRRLLLFEELPSTNDWLKSLALQDAEHGTVVIAKRQNFGHGRMQRLWESPQGGVWLSILLKPRLSLADAAKLTLSTGVALAQTFKELYGLEVGIKWPNDLVYEGKKIAGILGEVAGEWNAVQSLILGVGVNANFPLQQLSPELAATTLLEIVGQEVNLNGLAATFLYNLEKETHSLEQGDLQGLIRRWTSFAVGINQPVRIDRAGTVYTGVFKGIRENGELILSHEGREMAFSSGEVTLRAEGQYSPN
ncbi:birA, biotin-(acetyl-CoA-carboxylase) ligase [Desulfitobacterium dichloroeliminans LMG P-21439]|uniref:Bifunctional ligase/repressor BirA n=1 Tax=Desulfitobacterium dichloroeliminans (strain LMG P-21439 / DCA1) TaxID=871963 RepID=L0F1E4_DESDL|nr:biotin--[acetyl-CoA-carboxylase] ligase [Desulfitobacterium dichloroeliminans]AGA67664.1 birA, biotin-(acetyl-CoA-carboxylase) ligase [Desulfitobacterium dichloroeliminans LMG P-21439]